MSNSQSDVGRSVGQAQDAQRAARQAGRWFAGYLVLLGIVLAAWIVTLETVFSSGPARWVAWAAGGLLWLGLTWWAESRAMHPRGSRRSMSIAVASWFVGYLLVVGPLVRWQVGTSLGWWALTSLVLTSPFFIAAWRSRRTT